MYLLNNKEGCQIYGDPEKEKAVQSIHGVVYITLDVGHITQKIL